MEKLRFNRVLKREYGKKRESLLLPEAEISGNLRYHRAFRSELLQNERDIVIWLPPSYSANEDEHYPVLYMHDGQNLFDPATSYAGADWQVDECAERLIRENRMHEIIIVGINNSVERLSEYSDSRLGLAYRNFIIRELKPLIDSTYRTKPGRESTAVMGSSMGGLASLLIAWLNSEIFSMAGCLSSSFYYGNEKIFKHIALAPEKKNIRIYLDSGEDGKRDAQRMFCLLTNKGFVIGEDIDYFYDRGAHHTESAWAKRLERPLLFFFGK